MLDIQSTLVFISKEDPCYTRFLLGVSTPNAGIPTPFVGISSWFSKGLGAVVFQLVSRALTKVFCPHTVVNSASLWDREGIAS